jgi:succinate dehydrogenase/fumarate reductase cytochrome b subunit
MVFGKSAFDMRRGLGLLFFWISSVSLWSYFDGKKTSSLMSTIHLLSWFDKIPALTLIFGFYFCFLSISLFHVSYRKILSQFGEAGGYAYRKQIEMLNTFSDSIRERQEEKKNSHQKKKRGYEAVMKNSKVRSRNSHHENTDTQNDHSEGQSFFEKTQKQGISSGDKTDYQSELALKNWSYHSLSSYYY